MQSTEEYLDQLLASVNEQDEQHEQDVKSNKSSKPMKSIEELDESELTEEVLQKQLALLLGLEEAEDDMVATGAFVEQYATTLAEPVTETSVVEEIESMPVAEEMMQVPVTEEIESVPVAEEIISEGTVAETTTTEISSTGVLSADEIAALFAAMENETKAADETVVEDMSLQEMESIEASVIEEEFREEDFIEENPIETEVSTAQETTSMPQVSDTGVLSPDEIAALFATMGNDDSPTEETMAEEADADEEPEVVAEPEELPELQDMSAQEDAGLGLTREELEELGLGDIADVLIDSEQEILMEDMGDSAENAEDFLLESLMAQGEEPLETVVEPEEESCGQIDDTGHEIIDLPDFDGEMLLDIENVDAMLEATAKLAEETPADNADTWAEEDIMAMLSQFEEESIQESLANQEESAKAAELAVNNALNDEETDTEDVTTQDSTSKKKKKTKKEKGKKEKEPKEKPVKEKKEKVSLKDKIAAFMFEDDSLDDEINGDNPENAELSDLEEKKPTKEKKGKKEKASKKKDKKAKDGVPKDENAAIEAELAEEDKKKAKKKKEKPVKEKKAKKVVISEKTSAEVEAEKREARHSIGTKGIVATLLVCASLLGLILVGAYFLPKQLSLVTARNAYYAGNYEEATMRFMGEKLNDSDKILYEKAGLLYGLEERYHQYEIYAKRGMTQDALDTLLQGVVAADKEAALANQLGIQTEWKAMRDRFVKELQVQFGLDAETVNAVCELRNPDYTVAVENILAGRSFDDKSNYGGDVEEEQQSEESETVESNLEESVLNPEELEDLLPEEEAIIEQLQQENGTNPDAEVIAPEEGNNELYSGSVEGGSVNFAE